MQQRAPHVVLGVIQTRALQRAASRVVGALRPVMGARALHRDVVTTLGMDDNQIDFPAFVDDAECRASLAQFRSARKIDRDLAGFERDACLGQRLSRAAQRRNGSYSQRALEKTSALYFGWLIMPHKETGHAALELLTRLLADGESSILHELLVRDKAWARNVSAYTYDRSGPDGLVIDVELTQNAKFEQVEAAVRGVLNSLSKGGPKPSQLNRAIQRTKSSFVFDLQSNQSRANTFGEYEVVYGDARSVVNDLERLLAVTPDQIRRATADYLTPNAQTVIRVVPAEQSAATTKSGARQ